MTGSFVNNNVRTFNNGYDGFITGGPWVTRVIRLLGAIRVIRAIRTIRVIRFVNNNGRILLG